MSESKQRGWVIYKPAREFTVGYTFSNTRTEAIKKFIEGSSQSWKEWKTEANYECVRATQTITID